MILQKGMPVMANENSHALPLHYYRDPAEVVEHLQLRELGCVACDQHTNVLGRVMCTDPRKTTNKGVPHIGDKCKYFELRK